MPITVYYMNASVPSRSVLSTFNAAGVDVQKKTVDLMNGEQHQEWYLKMNPKHCVPTVDDNGFYMWESRATMRYIMNAYAPDSPLYPKDPKKRALVDRALDMDMGSVYKEVSAYVYPSLFMGKPTPDDKDLRAMLKDLETLTPLAQGKYLAGDAVTIADISTVNSITFLETVNYDLSAFPNVVAWIAKMKAKPFIAEINVMFEEFKQFMAQQKKK